MDQFWQQEQAWKAALIAKDATRLRQLLHPDFRLNGLRGAVMTALDREQWIAALEKMDLVGLTIELKDSLVLPQILTGSMIAHWRVRYLGQEIDEQVFINDVWVATAQGEWQVIRRHSTPMSQKNNIRPKK